MEYRTGRIHALLMDYNEKMFLNFESLTAGKWYAINPDRTDLKEFIEAIKLRIDTWHDMEFSSDYKKFKRTNPLRWDDEEYTLSPQYIGSGATNSKR